MSFVCGERSHLYVHSKPYQHHCIYQSTMFTLQILNWQHRNAHKQNNQSCTYFKREIKSQPPPCHSKSSNNKQKNSIHHSVTYKGKYCPEVWWWQQNNTPSPWKMIMHIKFRLKRKSLTYWWKINVKPVQNPILHFHTGQEKNVPSWSLFSVCPMLEARQQNNNRPVQTGGLVPHCGPAIVLLSWLSFCCNTTKQKWFRS